MSILLIGGIASGVFLFFNAGEYINRRYLLSRDVRRGKHPIDALNEYQRTVDTLYETLWPINIMLSPGIDLATKHFKKAYQVD